MPQASRVDMVLTRNVSVRDEECGNVQVYKMLLLIPYCMYKIYMYYNVIEAERFCFHCNYLTAYISTF